MPRALRVAASPLIWLTLVYLVFELSFSARLLDAAAMAATAADIHALERFGRALSGVALGLVAAGILLRRNRPIGAGRTYAMVATGLMLAGLAVDLHFGAEDPGLAAAGMVGAASAMLLFWRARRWNAAVGALALLLHVVASVAAMTSFQGRLVGAMVDRLGPEDRRAAAVLAEAAKRLSDCQVKVDDIFLCDGAASPSGKAFAAVFPLLAIGLPDLEQRVLPVLEKLGARKFTTECAPADGQCIGTLDHFIHEIWLPALRKVEKGPWADYQAQVLSGWRRQERAWDDYAAKLARRGLQPGTVPPTHWDAVRRQLRNEGIKVGDDWRPYDRAAFQAAVDAQAERKLLKAHKDGGLGTGSEPIGDFKVFFAQEGVQRRIREELGVSDRRMVLPAETDPAVIKARIYDPLVRQAVREYARVMGSAPADFSEDGRHGDIGTEAAHRAVVPPLALLFSLLGGGGHLLKLLILLTGATTGNVAVRTVASVVAVGALAWLPMARPNPVTGTEAYSNLHGAVAGFVGARAGGGRAAAGALEWTVRAQEIAYPFNEWIRTRILLGYGFGIETPVPPFVAVPASATSS